MQFNGSECEVGEVDSTVGAHGYTFGLKPKGAREVWGRDNGEGDKSEGEEVLDIHGGQIDFNRFRKG